MGGQACILYGAAEFSRDTDLVLLASESNLSRLRGALQELHCRRIALPPFSPEYLLRGHAVHFRCYHPDAAQLRLDLMSVLRGVDPFEQLWARRAALGGSAGNPYQVLSLPDLVQAKKTQRDKDWPMIRRLMEADYLRQDNPTTEQIRFWLLQSRTPEMIFDLLQSYPLEFGALASTRKALEVARSGDRIALQTELDREEFAERQADRLYWEPLRKELEELCHRGLPVEEVV